MVEALIEDFVGQVRRLLADVGTVGNGSFQKVLCLVMIDAMSAIRYPEEGVRKRFCDFVEAHGGWTDFNRISLPQADLVLREETERDAELQQFVSGRLDQWPQSTFHPLTVDPLPAEVPPANGGVTTAARRRVLQECRHGALLWALRNSLIHEFRHPGEGLDSVTESDAPHYMQVDFVEGPLAGQSGWELMMPRGFLKALAGRCLDGLEQWLRAEQRNPWTTFERGRLWLRPRR